MLLTVDKTQKYPVAVGFSQEVCITDASTALDWMFDVKYQTGCDRIALNKEAIAPSFFQLGSGIAGEILQKFVNYQMKFAIYGDFSCYQSKPLHDFIYECNHGKDIFFLDTKEEAVIYLGR